MKEFWIYYDDPSEPLGVYIGEKKNDGILKHTKVIEYSALTEALHASVQVVEQNEKLEAEITRLEAERDELREQVRTLHTHSIATLVKERDALQNLLAIREAQLIEKSPDFRDLKAELEQANIKIEQHRGALGYSVSANIPEDRTIKCGLCEAKTRSLLEEQESVTNLEVELIKQCDRTDEMIDLYDDLERQADELAAALDKVAYMDGATLDHLKQIARTALKSFKDSK